MVLIPNPNKIFDDTVYHYWVIKGDEFFLKDWDVYKHSSNYIPGDSLLRQKLDKIRDSLHLKLKNQWAGINDFTFPGCHAYPSGSPNRDRNL